MGTLCSVELWPAPGGPDRAALAAAAQAALDEVARWDAVLSDWNAATPLSRLNATSAGQPFAAGEDLLAFLRDADRWVTATDGAFDPGLGALVQAWGLRGPSPARPDTAVLLGARAASGWSLLALDPDAGTATRAHAGLHLDPGASGKGWALDRAGELLRAHGAVPALLSFRSTLLALGAPPGERGFTLPVVHDGAGRTLTQVLLHDVALSVSGGQAAGFDDGGLERGGCIDPLTGLPVPAAGLAWVVHPSAAAADALSTALLVRGVELPAVDGASGGWYADALAAPVAWPHQP
jgi:thiamine biosynthesis lipoprotein